MDFKRSMVGLMMLVFAIGCSSGSDGEDTTNVSDTGNATSESTNDAAKGNDVASRIVSDEPEGAKPLVDVKSSAAVGDDVTFVARIGGRAKPFVDGRAVMVVMDPSIPSCADNHGDTCAIPWDYCCETTETITTNAATVRVVDTEGDPVRTSFEAAGLEPLDRITFAGRVAEKDEGGRFVVDVASIYVHGE